MKSYTLRQASQLLGVPVAGLNRLINRGDLVAFQPNGEGSRLVVPKDELERLQRGGRRDPSDAAKMDGWTNQL